MKQFSAMKQTTVALLMMMGSWMTTTAQDIAVSQEEMVVEYYAVPSPEEILSYIHNNEITYTPKLMNSPTNSDKYQTSKERLVAFGMYLADMAYAGSFEQSGTALRYFEVTERSGKSMNLFPAEIEGLVERMLNNMNRIDSINNIYDELYLMVIANLHDTDRFGEYALISAGGFIEALYLALNSSDSDLKEDGFRMRVWDQKMILDQLKSMFNKYLNETQKAQVMKDFEGVFAAFDEFAKSPQATTSNKRDDGAMVLGAAPAKAKAVNPIENIHQEINLLRAKWVRE
ncbi:hypothetical protein [Geofilum rhodophaeum]|uniref:hypothetical protein n=1 Tax=Geofilum rhodophaeum TaxID=1965019 RepID=UPI000B51EB17|nr:hypothetical protein [Geofilum rhodophaeum]